MEVTPASLPVAVVFLVLLFAVSAVALVRLRLSLLRGAGAPAAPILLGASFLFLFVAGLDLLLLRSFSVDLPFYDQYYIEQDVYLSYLAGALRWRDVFRPFYEHFYVPSRVLLLWIFEVNGRQLDSQAQTLVNVFTHAVTAALLPFSLVRRGRGDVLLAVAAILLTLALPFATECRLYGYQTHFGMVLLLEVLALPLFCLSRPLSATWLLSLSLSALAVFSIGSGSFVAITLFGATILFYLGGSYGLREATVALAATGSIAAFGVLAERSFTVSGGGSFGAHSLSDFLTMLGRSSSFPFVEQHWVGLLLWAPSALLLLLVVRGAKSSAVTPGRVTVLALGLFAFLHALAVAYARANYGEIAPRSMDILSTGVIANALAAFELSALLPGWRRVLAPCVAGWTAVAFCGAFNLATLTFGARLPEERVNRAAQVVNVRHYLRSGDPRALRDKPVWQLPMPPNELKVLKGRLDDPRIRAMLPPSVREPIALESGGPGSIFPRAGEPLPGSPSPPSIWSPDFTAYDSWEKFTINPERGLFRSTSLRRGGAPYLRLELTGYFLGDRQSVSLVDEVNGEIRRVKPDQFNGRTWNLDWQGYLLERPAHDFRLVAEDQRSDLWFAFRAPVEVGRISWLAFQLMARGPLLIEVSLGLLIFAGALAWTRKEAEREQGTP